MTNKIEQATDYDVVVVGGGPAGCATAVFTARAGLDTIVFDRGRSSIRRCAYLENYPGFPGGIDIETFCALLHDHVETAGGEIVADMVESVDHRERGDGFRVEPQEGDAVIARRVVAATRYDGSYLRGLGDDDAMFETLEHDGETTESFRREYASENGTTPVEGLYVVTPAEPAEMQAISAAGRGASVARRVTADARIDDGWWDTVAFGVDWMRRDRELDEQWETREAWIEWFDDYYGATAPVDPDSDRFQRVRETVIDERMAVYLTPDEIESRKQAGHEQLATQLETTAVVSALDESDLLEAMDDETVLTAMDDETIQAYVEGDDSTTEVSRRGK